MMKKTAIVLCLLITPASAEVFEYDRDDYLMYEYTGPVFEREKDIYSRDNVKKWVKENYNKQYNFGKKYISPFMAVGKAIADEEVKVKWSVRF